MTRLRRSLIWIVLAVLFTACSGIPQKQIIKTPKAPIARGPYSQAVSYGNLLFVSGQIAVDPATNKFISDPDIAGQTRQVLENIKAILADNGMDMRNVLSTTVYLADVQDFRAMNEVYASYFSKPFPARATVGSPMAIPGARIEISVIAGR